MLEKENRSLAKSELVKILVAIILVPAAIWFSARYVNWISSGSQEAALIEKLTAEPAIAYAFELEKDDASALQQMLNEKLQERHRIGLDWVKKLSDANVFLILVKDWSHMKRFEGIAGFEEVSLAASMLPKADERAVYLLQNSDQGDVAIVIYMIPDVKPALFECIAEDFSALMVDGGSLPSSVVQTCR